MTYCIIFIMTYNIVENENKYITNLKNWGLNIEEGEAGIIQNILFKENTSIINEYKNIFIDKTSKKFYKDVNFNSIYSLFVFDRNLRNIYLKYILKVEHQIKTVLSCIFTSLYSDIGYLNLNNFDILNKNKSFDFSKIKEVLNFISRLESDLSSKIDKRTLLMDSMIENGYIPFNIFAHYLTIGEVSKFFSLMKQKDQILISKQYNILFKDFTVYLKSLTLARNLCAHDEKFFDFKYKILIKNEKLRIFNIPVKDGNYEYGINDAFSIAVVLFSFLDKEDANEFIFSLENEFSKLKVNISYELILKIKKEMGFNEYWKNLNLL